MKEFKTAQEVLDFAINMEEMSIKFYLDLAKASTSERMKPIYNELAAAEKTHKQTLENIDVERFCFSLKDKISNINIQDYYNPEINYENLKLTELLVIAISRERRSFMLYEKLAYIMTNPKLKKVFQYLSYEESSHKLTFEKTYCDYTSTEKQ